MSQVMSKCQVCKGNNFFNFANIGFDFGFGFNIGDRVDFGFDNWVGFDFGFGHKINSNTDLPYCRRFAQVNLCLSSSIMVTFLAFTHKSKVYCVHHHFYTKKGGTKCGNAC